MVYTASCSALAILEYRVHMSKFPRNMVLIHIDVPDALEIQRVEVLEVLSIIAPRQKNYLLNPRHRQFAAVRILDKNPFAFDTRLLSSVPTP